MKKFHKRAAVFLTAATLAGLPAGAFFYSSPGSLTVWADNVEVESSEESSPEDVDFSDGSEAEILADPVEQAQEDVHLQCWWNGKRASRTSRKRSIIWFIF